jgi:hypothetical protein
MGKLHLKRTPAEEEERQLRKERKAARKAAKSRVKARHSSEDDGGIYTHERLGSPYHKRRRTQCDDTHTQNDSSDEEYGPHPSAAHKPDYESILAQLEEQKFQEKMYGALEDDAGIFGVEERLNEFYVPKRWRESETGKGEGKRGLGLEYMEEEDYAEWVREGMWK